MSAIPEGWKLVPVRPTQEMCDSAKYTVHAGLSVFKWADGYYAMLAAAPQPPEIASLSDAQAEIARLRGALEEALWLAQSTDLVRAEDPLFTHLLNVTKP